MAVGTAPAVKIVDQSGATMAGVNVVFSVTAGGGSVDGGTAITDVNGVASVTKWTLGTTAGVNTLKAQSGNLSVTFTATGLAGAASALVKTSTDPQTAVVGSTVAAPPSVTVKDANGNPVAGVVVSFVVAGGGGSVTPASSSNPGTSASATSSATGVVTLGSWRLGTTAGANTLVVGSNGLPVVNFTATATAGPATALSVSPASVALVPALTGQLTAKLVDQYGNTATGVAPTFSTANGGVATVSNAGVVSGVAVGNTTVTVASGALSKTVPVSVATRVDVADAGAPFAVRVSTNGVLLVGEHANNRVGRFNLPSITKADSVAVGNNPTDVVFSADGSKAYVTNQADHTLGVINVATNTQVSTVDVGASSFRVAPSRDGSKVYVTTAAGTLVTVNATTLAAGAPLTLGGALNGLAVDPSQPVIYVTETGGMVYEVSETTGLVLRSVQSFGTAQEVVLSPDGSKLYIAMEDGPVQVRATSDLSLVTTIPAASNTFGAAITPNGTQLYVTQPSAGNVLVIDLATKTAIRTISGGAPRRVTIDQAGTTAFVGNEAGYVTIIK